MKDSEKIKILLEACKLTREYFVTFDGINVMKITKLLIKIDQAIYSAEEIK